MECQDGSDSDMEYEDMPNGSEEIRMTPGGKIKKKRPKFIRIVECQVCGDKANDHIHYGAISCYSCRAFFRRGVGAADSYQCTYGQTCEITVKTRKQCQFCRFKKCLDIGMKPTWLMTDEEKKEKKEKTIKRKILGEKMDKMSVQKETRTQYEERMREQRIQSRLDRKRKVKEKRDEEELFKKLPPLTQISYPEVDTPYSPEVEPETSSQTSLTPFFDNMDPESPPAGPMMLAASAAVLSDYIESSEEQQLEPEMEPEEPEVEPQNSPGIKEEPIDEYFDDALSQTSGFSEHSRALLPVSKVDNSPCMMITNEEKGFIKELWQLELNTSRSIPVPSDIMGMIVNAARTGTVIPVDAAIKGYSVCMQRVIKYASSMEFFNRLPQPDRFKLLLKNVDMVVNIRTARLLRPNVNLRDQLSHVVGWKHRNSQSQPTISQQNSTDQPLASSSNRLEVFQLFPSPWASSKNHEEKYENLLRQVFELRMDHFTTTLLTLLALFNDSEADLLMVPEEVKQLQEHFTLLLHRYLCQEVGRNNAALLLPQYKQAIKSLKEISQIFAEKRLKV